MNSMTTYSLCYSDPTGYYLLTWPSQTHRFYASIMTAMDLGKR